MRTSILPLNPDQIGIFDRLVHGRECSVCWVCFTAINAHCIAWGRKCNGQTLNAIKMLIPQSGHCYCMGSHCWTGAALQMKSRRRSGDNCLPPVLFWIRSLSSLRSLRIPHNTIMPVDLRQVVWCCQCAAAQHAWRTPVVVFLCVICFVTLCFRGCGDA